MDYIVGQYEEANRKKSLVMSTILTILLLILIFLPLFSHMNPPPGQEGVLVNLGLPDMGDGEDNAAPASTDEPETTEDYEEEVVEEVETQPIEEPVVSDPEPVKQKDVIETQDPEAIRLKKEQERQKKLEEDRKEKERQEEIQRQKQLEAQRKAEAEKKKKAEEDARKKAEAEALKNKIGGLFGDGDGKGNTGKPGNQGDPNGDPNSDILEGKSTGTGKVGGGLGSRGVSKSPKVVNRTQYSGTVVIRLCVDRNGNVIGTPEFTQAGSTTTNRSLVQIAIANAKEWKFNQGSLDKQCGTITYNFKFK
ncbi:MAG: hypothetical protein KDC24_09245 [Saprospiraceae bacterium]|nr:hypothetical protein [Saprospiraceae bacterium]